jgi:hypothetical protein
MYTKTLIISVIFCIYSTVGAQESKKIDIQGLFTSSDIPTGYTSSKQEIKQGDKILGHKVLITKQGSASKVVLNREARKISTKGQKVAAFKGYINGTAKSLQQAGLKLSKHSIPDISKAGLSKLQIVELTFTAADGTSIFVQIQVLFIKDTGSHALILTTDKQDYISLSKWASTVQPK